MKNLTSFLFCIFAIVLLLSAACGGGDDDDNGDNDPGDDDDDDDTGGDDDDDDDVPPETLDLIEGCNPFATSDECLLPYPSAFYQEEDETSATGARMAYPADALPYPDDLPPLEMERFNAADGSSPAGPILLHFAADVDPDQLTFQREIEESVEIDNPILLIDLVTGELVPHMSEMDRNLKEEYPDRYALIIRPLVPMKMSHRHAVVLKIGLRDDEGNLLESPRAFEVLRDDVPVTNEEIEDVRDDYEEMFDFFETLGLSRNELLLAWDFMVASEDFELGSIRSIRERALEEVAEAPFSYSITRNDLDPRADLVRYVEGTFEVPAFLADDNEFDYDENHHPLRQDGTLSYPFTMLIPKVAETGGEPLPLVIFGHGLFGSGRGYLGGGMQDKLAPVINDAGLIFIATDWIGLSSGDLELILIEVLPNLNRIQLITDRLQQSLINNLILQETAIESMSTDPDLTVGGYPLVDEDRIYYYGGSLGGIQGSSFASISNRVTRSVCSVFGSGWMNLFTRSTNWNLIKPVLDLNYPDPLTQQIGIAFVQHLFDLSDPINLTRMLYEVPPPDVPDERVIILQEAIGDSQVPNLTSEMLARAIGVDLMTPSIFDVYGMETTTSPTTDSALIQVYLVDQVEENPPPEENVPPESGNGAHGDMVFLDHMLEQVELFFNTGEIVNTCDGACDPD